MSNFVTPWTVARQTPLSVGFPGKNTRVGCYCLLQGIFLTNRLNPQLLHWEVLTGGLFIAESPGKPRMMMHTAHMITKGER